MRLPPLPTIKDILRVYKIRALKQLSQNFLLDSRITKRFVKSAGSLKNHLVIEVGPGPGSITRSILEAQIERLVVIEKDSRFMQSLELLRDVSTIPIDIIHADILMYDLQKSIPENLSMPWEEKPPLIHIIGNLPFNVSTPLIVKWLHDISRKSGAWSFGRIGMTLTFQKEIGERMIASVNDEQRSRLSIMTQYLCDVRVINNIPGSAFLPKPDVDVAVVRFRPRVVPLINAPFEYVNKAVSLIFHHRNKIFKNCIATFFPPDRPDLIEELGNRSTIPIDTVPRQITMEQFSNLCNIYMEICSREPHLTHYNYRDSKNIDAWRKRKTIWRQIHGDDDYFQEDNEHTTETVVNSNH